MPIQNASISSETRDRYLTYALSVVSGRALPDVRDGLKPVQRRILYAMLNNLRLRPEGSHKKSAAVVGEVLARFHPHGDSACYEAMVRMAQNFSLRYPLVDGQGNFGSLDGDNAAAYRYTETKLLPLAIEVLGEIHEDTVPYIDNFDGSQQEPCVLPSRVPNLLINGTSGIAVGMATNIPPHNLKEVVNALIELSEDSKITTKKLCNFIKAPDFPTACQIVNTKKQLEEVYETGRGTIRMRADWNLEEVRKGKEVIVITSIPYALSKASLIEKIANLIIDKRVPQLVDVRDESTEDIRVVLELANGADPELAINYLFKNSPLESNFNVNLTCLVPDGKALVPKLVSLKEMLQHFLTFRQEVVVKRLKFERKNLLERIHILEGFVTIFDDLDMAIKIVRKSSGRSDAAQKLRKHFKLTEIQSFAIVDLRIYQLSKTNIGEIKAELAEKAKRVAAIEALLKSKKKIANLVIKELKELSANFGDNRKSKIIKTDEKLEIDESAYLLKEDAYAIVTADGWIKRIRQNNELSSTRIREGDEIAFALPLNTVDQVAFITNKGFLYTLRVADFPSSSGYGSPIQKLLSFKDGERIVSTYGIIHAEEYQIEEDQMIDQESNVLMISEKGTGLAMELPELDGIKKNGKRIMKLRKNDFLAATCLFETDILFLTKKASALKVAKKQIPVREQAGVGVALMGVRADDKVIGALPAAKGSFKVNKIKGKSIEIKFSEIAKSKRALKGKKVCNGNVKSIELVR
ncbi:UNVERIFIED_CONTAM: hypothetical protein GTU68_029884 [Idotea baltica]|nr:hypothetical protein [Idotea baltica]